MEEQLENDNSSNVADEQELETNVEETPVETEDVTVLKEKLNDLSGKNKQLFERAKKAEGFEKNAEGHWIKTQKPEAPPLPVPQSNEPDYAKLAFLETKGIAHPDDQKLVQDEALRLKLPLTDILGMEHIKSKLQIAKDQREAQAGMPKGRGSASGKTQNDVDYWLAKGETPDDQELGQKVIEARIQKEKQGNKFSDELYTG
jgi:hypothetical protein